MLMTNFQSFWVSVQWHSVSKNVCNTMVHFI